VAEEGSRVIGDPHAPLAVLGLFGQAIDFIFNGQQAKTATIHVGGFDQVIDLAWTQLKLTGLAMAIALAVALPAGLLLGHSGRGELFAVAIGNAGRAIPELAIIALIATVIGVGLLNVTIALAILAVPPILTNTFVAVRQVDRGVVDAARGMGMSTAGIISRVELPLAVPTIMGGVRTSTINVVATATIAPLAGVVTLGDFIISRNVYGDNGVLAGAICVALLALALELSLAGLQRLMTSPGLRLQRQAA
jgi:osmoprotectant transport system permease protein